MNLLNKLIKAMESLRYGTVIVNNCLNEKALFGILMKDTKKKLYMQQSTTLLKVLNIIREKVVQLFKRNRIIPVDTDGISDL